MVFLDLQMRLSCCNYCIGCGREQEKNPIHSRQQTPLKLEKMLRKQQQQQQQQQQQPVPSNSSFGHSTYVVKRRSVPTRLSLARIRTTTTTTITTRHVIIIHNFHTDFFPLHYAVPPTKTALISSAYISWTKAPRADSKTSFRTQIHEEDAHLSLISAPTECKHCMCPPSSPRARTRNEVSMADMGI